MGHKVSTLAFRLQLNKNWKSRWFSRHNFRQNLISDVEIRENLDKRFGKTTGVALTEIVRDQDSVKIIIHTAKPGILIGRSGQGINEIKKYLFKNCKSLINSKTGQPSNKLEIEIMEVKEPNLSAEVVAQIIALQIEKRIAYKRAIKQAITKVMEAKAKGVKVAVAGRLNGAEIARKEHYGNGSVPLGRFRADIDYAQIDALTSYGVIGVKVWIYKGDKIEQE